MARLKLFFAAATLAVLSTAYASQSTAARVPSEQSRKSATFTAEIAGSTSVRPNTACYWYAEVDGGTPPYFYDWYDFPGWFSYYGQQILGHAQYSGTIELHVWDANNQLAIATLPVTLSNSGDTC